MVERLVILGGGFTGCAVARLAIAAGLEVAATTRSEARAGALRSIGASALLLDLLDAGGARTLASSIDPSVRVLVTFPPDGETDRALAPIAASARAIAYVSSTGVYGQARGRVDESTPVDPGEPRAAARLGAEQVWRQAGAAVVRAPAIYGPGRGLHLRLARGEVRLAEDRGNAISRVHVDDLAAALLALLLRDDRATYVIGDDAPSPHAEVVRWLCQTMRLPDPPPTREVDATLRNDRRVDPSRLRAALGIAPLYPTYREGFAHCLRVDAAVIDAALRERGVRPEPRPSGV
jgi:nucleoside-diphosphate-sugar epimerase